MDSKLAEFDEELPLRPSLLTVLCILTFIGSGWTMISSIIAYSTAPQYVKMFTANTKRQREEISLNDSLSHKDSLTKKTAHKRDSAFGEKMMTSMSKIVTTDNIRKSAIGGIISALFTLFGALLMWRLKRNGFYIYIVGIIIAFIVPIYLYGNNFIAIGISSISIFFGLVFIALYALNIKSLK